MKRITFMVLAILLLTMPQWLTRAPVAAAQASLEPDCLFFAETGGEEGGFLVCDDDYARFRAAFEGWGLQKIGYPISQRYYHDGFVTQAFQKAIMQWRPDGNYVALVNIFDDLHNAGFDDTLLSVRQTPHQLPAGWDGDIPFDEVVKKRQALLEVRPALQETYFASSDPLTFYGLPTSDVVDMGNHYAIRLQRAVLQEWKEQVPWAKEGEVTIANGGDIAKELAALPGHALIPEKVVALPSSANTLFHHPSIVDVAWANDHTLAVAAADGIWLYDTNALDSGPQFLSGSICFNRGLPCVSELTVSHNGEWLAASLMGERNNSLLLWSLTSLGEPKVLADTSTSSGHRTPVFAWDLVISPNGRSVAFVDSAPPPFLPDEESLSHDMYIWDVVRGEVKRLPNSLGPITALSFASDGAVVMAGIQKFASRPELLGEGTIRRWNVSNYEELDALSVQTPIAFSPDGQTAATKGSDLVQLWDLSNEPVISGGVGAPLSPGSTLFGFAFSQDGSKLAATIRSPEDVFNIEVWDVNTGSQLGSVPTRTLMAWSGSGRFAAFRDPSTTNNDYWLWDVTQNTRLAILARESTRLEHITFSPNERWLVSTNLRLLQLSNIE
ncbi:MAG: WD40 repeat domain-containing protein [Ardenticatenaceae bacterium]